MVEVISWTSTNAVQCRNCETSYFVIGERCERLFRFRCSLCLSVWEMFLALDKNNIERLYPMKSVTGTF